MAYIGVHISRANVTLSVIAVYNNLWNNNSAMRYHALLFINSPTWVFSRSHFYLHADRVCLSENIMYIAQSVDLINNKNCLRAKGESDKRTTVAWAIFTAVLGEPENSHEGHTLVCFCQRQTRPTNEIHNASSRGNRTQLVRVFLENPVGAQASLKYRTKGIRG